MTPSSQQPTERSLLGSPRPEVGIWLVSSMAADEGKPKAAAERVAVPQCFATLSLKESCHDLSGEPDRRIKA